MTEKSTATPGLTARVASTVGSAGGKIGLTHEQFQSQIVELLHVLGFAHLHVRRSIGKGARWVTTTSRVGWPDLLAWAPGRGFVAIEVKVGKDKPTPEQLEVLAELEAAGARTMVARPEDWDAVVALLRHPPGRPQSH